MQAFTKLLDYMQEPLPSISEQKRLPYRPSKKQVVYFYKLINSSIFNDKLDMPAIELMARCPRYWGMTYCEHAPIKYRKTRCKIRLMDKFYSRSWMISILAHEMVHVYQWDIIGLERENIGKERIVSHGPSFFLFRNEFAKHGLPLKTALYSTRWFNYQDMFKC